MIIGLVGFIGAGKGTVADILCDKYDFHKIAFGDTLKDVVSVVFGWQRHLLEGDTTESREFRETPDDFWSARLDYEVTPRKILQTVGTEAFRDTIHSSIWAIVVENKIRLMMANEFKNNFVIPDVRFPNEMEIIRRMGGYVVRVARGKDPKWFNTALDHNIKGVYEMHNKFPDVHVSEWAWIGQNMDYQINNNSSLIMLEADVDHMMKVFTGPKNPDIIKAA